MIKKGRFCVLFLLLLMFLLPFSMQGQMIKEVARNKNDFLLDVTTILEYSSNKDFLAKGEELIGNFSGVWESGYFKDHHRDKIYDISNEMLKKSMRSYPHFYDFVSLLTSFVSRGLEDKDLELWLTELDTLGKQRSSRAMSDFLEYSMNLFENSMLFETRSRAWYFRNGGFNFEYDTALFVYFPETDLICSTGRDSMEILKTRGKYYLKGEQWIGKTGKISWRRAGFHEDTVYAELKYYAADLKTLTFSADSVIFYNKLYFDFPMMGSFEEKVLSSPPGTRASYPRFESYFKEYEVYAIFENVNFFGGIGMQGRKLLCIGNGEQAARFVFKKGGDYFAVIRSQQFEIEGPEVMSSPASFSIYFDKDSIYHPGLQMKYDSRDKLLSLMRLNRGIAQSPFFNAYHKVSMYCEALYWIMNSEELSFEAIKGLGFESRSDFESDNYYSEFEYYKLQGIDEVNPLVLVKKYSDRYSTRTVKVGAFADFISKPVEQAVSMLLMLDSKGFVVYNAEKRDALIKDRLFDYIDAHAGNIDYDVIRFNSVTKQMSNAMVELASFDMIIRGVPEIFLSDSQKVYIYPVNEEIVMKKNKDFTFSGRVKAGLFEFYARDCTFGYDTFKIDLPQIDSMSFFVRLPDTSGQKAVDHFYRVQAVVENMTGFLLIDKPGNKSGIKTYPQYPIFTSTANSFVYYDGLADLDSIYSREHFYYELDPFVLDSLDNFSTTGLKFKGYLASGGILPPLENELVVMPDKSLGVNSITDTAGLPLYEGKAMFYDTITMDNAGMHGAGRFEYLTSVTKASDIDFFPDSVISTTNSFHIEKLMGNVEYADVSIGKASQKWFPDSGLMVIDMIEEPFSVFDSTANLRGSMELSQYGLKGRGDFTFERALIESQDIVFGHHTMSADTSDFKLYADSSFTQLAFLTDDYRTDLDFDQRQGKFISTGLSSLVDMPFNQFVCYMDEIYWQMDDQMMTLQNNIAKEIPDINDKSMAELIDLNLRGSDFISTHPDQDSLRFFSTKAKFSIQKNIINAEDVKIIRVADAAIFPGDGKLNILKDAQIETLKHADIIADTALKYHHIHDANINIYSRHRYLANGSIDYADVSGEISPIFLNTINVDSLGRTYGFGYLSDTAAFKLDPAFDFVGNVKLESRQEFMRFDGYFSIDQDCFTAYSNRVLMDTLIDPDNIVIPVYDSLRGPDGEHILASLMYSPGTESFYPAFLTAQKRESDVAVMSAKGVLTHDVNKELFKVSEVSEDSLQSYLAFHSDNCVVEGLGEVDSGMDLPHIVLDLYGNAAHYIIPDSTRFDLVMGYDFFFDQNVLRRFSRSLSEANLPGTETSDPRFVNFLKQKVPPGEVDKIIKDLGTVGTIRKLPEGMNYTILLSRVKFNWNPQNSSFVSYGDIGIFSIGDEVVNRMLPGYVEIERKANGYGVVNLYFEIPEGDWYFFSYRNYIMQAISSNEGFNNEILNLSEDKRIIYSKDEEVPYEFVISSKRKMIDFKRKMEEINGIQ